MRITMFDPREHERLTDDEWDEDRARTFVERIVREADAAYDREHSWPSHPEDRDDDAAARFHGIYFGAAGTMWALVHLARVYGIPLQHEYGVEIVRCEEAYRAHPAETEIAVPSYFLGTVGIMTARYAITGERAVLDPIGAEIRANIGNPTREALWGSPGTALAALLVRERDEVDRFDDVLHAVQDELWSTRQPAGRDGGLLWKQELYGESRCFVGAAHGAVGNLAPFVRARDLLSPKRKAALREYVPALLETYVIRDGDAANWFALGNPPDGNRLQWCHGSAGVILGLAAYPADDERVERLLIAGGEGIWQAGPLRKGPTLCHGTAGNGFALLRLARRTNKKRWKKRARRFAMHAIAQVAQWRRTFGMPAFSLWTGELGVALFVDAVLRNDPAVLTLDVL